MATSSTIGILRKNGTIDAVYCHYDGYREYNGAVLLYHYDTKEKVEKLISLGSLSSLNKKVTPLTDEHSFRTPEKDVVVAYHRDRGEDLFIFKTDSLADWENFNEEYNYIFKEEDEKWYIFDYPYIKSEKKDFVLLILSESEIEFAKEAEIIK